MNTTDEKTGKTTNVRFMVEVDGLFTVSTKKFQNAHQKNQKLHENEVFFEDHQYVAYLDFCRWKLRFKRGERSNEYLDERLMVKVPFPHLDQPYIRVYSEERDEYMQINLTWV